MMIFCRQTVGSNMRTLRVCLPADAICRENRVTRAAGGVVGVVRAEEVFGPGSIGSKYVDDLHGLIVDGDCNMQAAVGKCIERGSGDELNVTRAGTV
jgi:hypothetical protein